MKFGILGTYLILPGQNYYINAPKQRNLMAVLTVNENVLIPVERLAQEVWHGEPPPSATNLIRQYVFRLRRSLPPAVSRTIVTGPGGYKLRLTRGDVDSHLFDANVVRGRAAFAAGRLEDAVRALSEALAAWRGDPLADVDPSPSILAETRRLGERRLLAIEMRADAYLRLGWYDEAVEELAALVTLHPERERLRDMQMRVLCRVGRRADALAVYRDLRQTLADGVGIEPGPELQRLHRRVLDGDPALSGPPDARRSTPAGWSGSAYR
ncbi:AfsR/SARP family transcriptional regulator [Micromonospora matsumotoense]|uniref:AfsR/SARP family transcriptional regulator n=1 Tax=Micromonospora matsumotoense TaxID=121616 RepID=UPI00342E6DE1